MNQTSQRIKVVLFDLGSTLIYFDADWPETQAAANRAMLSSLRKSGLKLDEARFLADFDQRLKEYWDAREVQFVEQSTEFVLTSLLAEHGITNPDSRLIRNALKDLYAVTQKHWHIEEDTILTLDQLKARGYRLGLISNAANSHDVETLIDNAGIRSYFEIILISADVGLRKPHSYIFQLALDHFKVRPEETAMVGDTLSADILGANQMGMLSVWITRRAERPDNQERMQDIQPQIAISSLAELPDQLDNWN